MCKHLGKPPPQPPTHLLLHSLWEAHLSAQGKAGRRAYTKKPFDPNSLSHARTISASDLAKCRSDRLFVSSQGFQLHCLEKEVFSMKLITKTNRKLSVSIKHI